MKEWEKKQKNKSQPKSGIPPFGLEGKKKHA